MAVINSLAVRPFVALAVTFGEGYGWRGHPQAELVKLGCGLPACPEQCRGRAAAVMPMALIA